jgi:hypothetical protein
MLHIFYDFDKNRKVGFMRGIKVLALIWTTFVQTYYYAFISYPINTLETPQITTNGLSVVFLSGMIFGYDMFIFYAAFSVMNEKLKSIYIQNIKFNLLLYIIKTYLQYVLPISIFLTLMTCAYPFIDDSSPIYAYITDKYFVANC